MPIGVWESSSIPMVDWTHNCESSVLMKALESDDCINAVTQIVSENKSLVNDTDGKGCTPLCFAIKTDLDLKIIEYLILNGADVNKRDKFSSTPLHYAKKSCVVKLLLKCGAAVNAKNGNYCTPLSTALANKEDQQVILELINSNSDINACNFVGETALHLAFQSGYDAEIIREIFSRTKNVNKVDRFGFTPLYYAASHYKKYGKEFIFELVSKGAVISNDNFKILLSSKDCDRNFLVAVIKCGIDINCLDSDSNSVLHFVNDPESVRLFVKNGASVNHKNYFGLTPLMNALKNREQLSVIKSFLDCGTYLSDCLEWYLKNPKSSIGLSVYRSGIMNFHYDNEIMCELILHGAVINLRNKIFLEWFNKLVSEMDFDRFGDSLILSDFSAFTHVLVSNEYSSVIELITEKKSSKSFFNIFHRCFNPELEKMMKTNILNNISFYDFCVKYYKSRKHRINASNCEYILDDYKKIDCMFPNFKGAIISKIKINLKIQNRLKLLKKLYGITVSSVNYGNLLLNNSSLANVQLNGDCLYHIGNYLNDWDINSVICAAFEGELS